MKHVFLPQTEEEFLENLTQDFAEDPVDEEEEDEAEEDSEDEEEEEEYEEREKEHSRNGSSKTVSSPLESRADISSMVFALQQEGEATAPSLHIHITVSTHIYSMYIIDAYVHLHTCVFVCMYVRIFIHCVCTHTIMSLLNISKSFAIASFFNLFYLSLFGDITGFSGPVSWLKKSLLNTAEDREQDGESHKLCFSLVLLITPALVLRREKKQISIIDAVQMSCLEGCGLFCRFLPGCASGSPGSGKRGRHGEQELP